MIAEIITGNDVHQTASKKARYGHRDWVVWVDQSGVKHAAIKTQEILKAALLGVGTQGVFYVYGANDGMPFLVRWRMGVIMFRNAKYGV